MSFDWTPDKCDLLRRLWEHTTLSATQIGVQMQVKRNAAIGKAFRMKLNKFIDPDAKIRPTPKPKQRDHTWERRRTRMNKAMITMEQIERVEEDLTPPEGKFNCAVWDLTPRNCKYPIVHTEGRWLFCGEVIEVGVIYCSYHRAMCYQQAANDNRIVARVY